MNRYWIMNRYFYNEYYLWIDIFKEYNVTITPWVNLLGMKVKGPTCDFSWGIGRRLSMKLIYPLYHHMLKWFSWCIICYWVQTMFLQQELKWFLFFNLATKIQGHREREEAFLSPDSLTSLWCFQVPSVQGIIVKDCLSFFFIKFLKAGF